MAADRRYKALIFALSNIAALSGLVACSAPDSPNLAGVSWVDEGITTPQRTAEISAPLEMSGDCVGIRPDGRTFHQFMFAQKPQIVRSTTGVAYRIEGREFSLGDIVWGEAQAYTKEQATDLRDPRSGLICAANVVVMWTIFEGESQ